MICGGPGYGKTSALLAWTNERVRAGETIVWLTLDAALAQRATFWMVLLHRIRDAGLPVDGELIDALTSSDESAAPTLPALVLRQFAPTAHPMILVVDNVGDEVADDALVDDLVRLVTHDCAIRVVFTTRRSPGTTGIERRLQSSLAVSEPALLLLAPDEVASLARALHVTLASTEAHRIAEETGGWAFAVTAELTSHSDHTHAISPGARMAQELAAEEGYPGLRLLSVARRIDDELLSRLGLGAATRALMSRCRDLGLGWWEDGPPSTYRLRPVLRRALAHELTDVDPEAAASAHRVLAELQEERGEYSAAFASAVSASEWSLAARLYRRSITRSTTRRTASTAVVRRIPAGALRSQPILMFAAALDDFATGRRARSVRRLTGLLLATQGRQRLRRTSFTVDDVWLQGIVALSLRLLGKYDISAAAVRRLHHMLERTRDPDGELDDAMSLILSQSALSMLFSDDLDDALRMLGEAGIDHLVDRPLVDRVRIHGTSALVLTQYGDIRAAREHLDAISALRPTDELTRSYLAVPSVIARARTLIEDGEGHEAERVIALTDPHWPTTELWPLILHTRVRAVWLVADAATALHAFDSGMRDKGETTPPSRAMSVMLTLLHCDLLLAAGRASEAQTLITSSAHQRSRRLNLARARLRLHRGDALGASSVALTTLTSMSHPHDIASLSIIAASAAMQIGDDADDISRRLERPLALARTNGLVTPFTLVPPRDAAAMLDSAPEVRRTVARLAPLHPPESTGIELTTREHLILEAIAERKSVAETADALSVSVNTVKSQRRSLYRKLGAGSRIEALDAARRRGLL